MDQVHSGTTPSCEGIAHIVCPSVFTEIPRPRSRLAIRFNALRALAIGASWSCLTACAASPPITHVAEPVTVAPSSDYVAAIAHARDARVRARAEQVPSAGELEAANGEETIDAILERWAIARRDATQAAQRAYAEALRVAHTPEEEAEVHAELAEMWLGVQSDIESALLAATPAKYRDEPSLVSMVQIGTTVALRPLRDRVAVHVDMCERIAHERAPNGSMAETCTKSSDRFLETLTAHATMPPETTPRFGTSLDARIAGVPNGSTTTTEAHPIVPTTRPKPCTFKGTLVTRGTIYAEKTGSQAVLPILGTPIEVDALDVPDQPGGRYKVSVIWPTVATGWLEAAEPPFVLTKQVELVPESAWVEPGEHVAASEARGPTVRATRTFEDPIGGTSQRKPMPEGLDRRLFCHDLDLATASSTTHTSTSTKGDEAKLRTDMVVPLLKGPNGKEVARIVAGDVRLLERRGPYAHVAGGAPFGFDGWVDAGYLQHAGQSAQADGRETMYPNDSATRTLGSSSTLR